MIAKTATIYHNPRCTKSGLTLQLLKDNNITPNIVFYLETPPNIEEIKSILAMLDVSVRDIMRIDEVEYKDNNLNNQSVSEEELLESIIKYPILLQRPIVVIDKKAAIGRPPENILKIV